MLVSGSPVLRRSLTAASKRFKEITRSGLHWRATVPKLRCAILYRLRFSWPPRSREIRCNTPRASTTIPAPPAPHWPPPPWPPPPWPPPPPPRPPPPPPPWPNAVGAPRVPKRVTATSITQHRSCLTAMRYLNIGDWESRLEKVPRLRKTNRYAPANRTTEADRRNVLLTERNDRRPVKEI